MNGRKSLVDALDRTSGALDAELSAFDDAREVLVFARCFFALVVGLKKESPESDNVAKGDRQSGNSFGTTPFGACSGRRCILYSDMKSAPGGGLALKLGLGFRKILVSLILSFPRFRPLREFTSM